LRAHPLSDEGIQDGQIYQIPWMQSDSRPEIQLTVSSHVPSCDWQVLMMEPIWLTQRKIAGLYMLMLSWGVAALMLALVRAHATANDITQSLQQIAGATQALVRAEALPVPTADLVPSREFSVISKDLHEAAVALGKSIDERNVSQTELRQILAHLDEKVRQRTAQLDEARSTAELANTAKNEFLASVSHELRTPLNVILGMADFLREQYGGPLTERQVECIVAVEESARHLLVLINDVLDLSKVEAGMMQLEFADMDIKDTCEAAVRLVREEAVKKSIQLTALYHQTQETMHADPLRIKQILVNLLSNAVKFTPDGGRVSLVVVQTPKSVQFVVRDNGIGIDPQQAGKLFQAFRQINSALNRKYAGTGLGLALVKRMAELHGGTVGVLSELGKGSCFTVSIPLTAGIPSLKSKLGAVASYNNLAKPQTQLIAGNPHILIVEDNPTNVKILTEHLHRSPCKVSVATTGFEALEHIYSNHPDVVLMDIQIPELNGLEVIQRLREDPKMQQLPIIAITVMDTPEDQKHCMAAGASAYFAKPVDFDQLNIKINELLVKPNESPNPGG
jgi:signal transduction histidine kinase/ActR/RegA family two-component response regulator